MRTNPGRIAAHTALVYAIVAAVWILISDRMVVAFTSDPATIWKLSTYKGWAFVAVTAALLYVALRGQLRRWEQEAAARRKAEEAARRLEMLASHSRDVILLLRRADGGILEANAAASQAYGYTHAELLTRTIFDLRAAGTQQRTAEQMQTAASEGILFESVHCRKDGSTFPVEVSSQGVVTGGTPALISVIRDITGRKKLEEQYRQVQKLEEIGQLASGITHDFNNILTVIQMQVSLLENADGLTPEVATSVREISDAARHAAGLTRQLLTFSRRQVMQLENLDLNKVVANMAKMLERILGEDVRVQLNYAPVPLPIHADAGMIEQILLNLGVNSRDAMPNGGRLVIDTAAVDFDGGADARLPQARPGPFVRLSVSDTGTGIAPEILPHIFEPFFTTKDVGRGTGMGMATVHGIVNQHRGWITVESEVGRGTTFHVYLPRQLTPMADSRPAVPPASSERGRGESILLVEDEVTVRALVQMVLTQFGYRVMEATTGAAALEVWEKHGTEIRLLLTDYLMPDGMTGLELARQLRQKNPQLRIIMTSGYSPEIARTDPTLNSTIIFLPKPFEVSRLLSAVRSCLDAIPGVP